MATVKEIAERANVSIGTVDRVIHNRGRVSSDTRKRIEDIIRELDYSPNFFAKNLRRGQNYRFSVLMPRKEQDNSFWSLIWQGMEKATAELSAYNIEVTPYYYDRNSDRSFQIQSNKILSEIPDGLIIAPVLSVNLKDFIERIPDTVPYVFVDSRIDNSKPISYIGHHPYKSGVLAAKLMKLLAGEKQGTIAVIRSYLEEYHMDQRARGFHSYFANDEGITLVDYNITGVENRKSYTEITKRCVQSNSDLIGIFVTNVYTNYVAEYLSVLDQTQKPKLIGYDLVKENIKYLKDGVIDFLLSHRPDIQGYNALMQLYDYRVIKRDVESEPFMPIDILTKENIDFIKI